MDLVDRLQYARVLVALGELREAEQEVERLLDAHPEDLAALSLFAKIKHMLGELTVAIACWAQIHARSSHGEAARLHIASLLKLAQAPARNAGEFLAMGQLQLVRKPVAYLELEAAFQLYLARQPIQARRHCQLVADKYRFRDAAVYKLAVLCDAWISEHIGDLETACHTLERLGHDPQLAGDLDRVLTLAALCERIGTRERLEQAMHIYRFLERSGGGVEVQGLLARGYRRLGLLERAAEHERRHLLAFRQTMDRPSRTETVEVGAEHYLPIARLRASLDGLDPEDADSSGAPTPLERALDQALRGRIEEAAAGLADRPGLIERKYSADLAQLSGQQGEAARRWLDVLVAEHAEHGQVDRWVIGQLLDLHAVEPNVELARLLTSSAALFADALRVLEGAIATDPGNPRPWRQLAILHQLLGRTDEQRRATERAEALASAERERQNSVGRVPAAAVYHFVGRPRGLIHEIWAGREPADGPRGGTLADADIHGNLTDEMRADVRNIFVAVRQYARAKLPHRTEDLMRYRYTFKVTKEDEPSGGLSAGLPTALAFLSVFLQREFPQDMASSGALVTDSHHAIAVRPVGDIEHKVAAAYHRHLSRVILPAENRPFLEGSALIPRAVAANLVAWVHNLDEAIKLTFGARTFVE